MSTLTRVLIVSTLMATALTSGPASAGDPYAVQNSYEGLDHEGEKIQSIRIPVNITLRSWHERPFGLRLRLAGTFATSDLESLLDGEFEKISMSSFLPGLEVVIPVGQNHLLRPHIDAGIGFASGSDKAEFLAAIGLRTEFIFAGKYYFAGFEPGFQVNTRPGADPENDVAFSPFITLSARRLLGFTIAGHQPDAGIFIETGYDFNALELTSVRSTRDAVNSQYEVGVGIGFSQSQPKIGPFRIPRIRIGYRFGDLEGWRVRIGGDWLNSVLGLNQLTP
ncbi:MAG: hypothetical protein KAH56_05675 [Candidatus Krumholzibacteria bacterium]|nr:hypothetical protein [Candidatus Krumholzibacteria bacterium]